MRTQNLLILLITLASARGFAADATLPLFFLPNPSPATSPIQFVAQTPELQVGLGENVAILRARGMQVRIRFVAADPGVTLTGADPLPAKASFFNGSNPENWRPGLPTYRKVLYRGLYPGIDMTYGGDGARIKSEFLVAPGGNPAQIRIEYEDAQSVSIAENGDLVVSVKSGELREQTPVIYQNSAAGRVRINGGYRMLAPRTVGFEIRRYDPSRPLVIDPTVSYSTYLGGSGMSAVTGIATDPSGNLYATGWTEALDFPVDGAIQASNQGGVDAFVVKMNAAGTALMYATYIGGREDDRGAGIAVDSSGQAYVAGSTSSTNFPLASPMQSTLKGSRTAFALKLNPAGSALLYSTYLGGSNYDLGNAIALDSSGNVYIAGDTLSVNFPVLNAFQSASGGNTDAFVTKLSPSGTMLLSTYLGGAGNDHAGGIAVDSSGNIYVAGGTFSVNFPVHNPIQSLSGGGQDIFVSKISSAGTTLMYSTYLGGAGGSQAMAEQANSIALDSSGNAYIGGVTNSANFPVTSGALQTVYNGAQDGFVAKINAAGSALSYSTYLGGSSFNWISGIAVDSSGNAYVSGYTSSFDFPTVGAVQVAFNGYYDAFVSELNGAGSALTFSTLWGGTLADEANAIALASNGTIFTGGATNSVDLPLVAPIQSVNSGGSTGWVMHIGAAVQASSGTAQFVKADTSTQGSWEGVYGGDGYNVIGDVANYPSYVTPAPSGNSLYTWAVGSSDVRAMQEPGSSARIAATWFSTSQFTVDLPLTGSATHQMAVYCLDWDNLGRAQTIQILDANNNVLDTRSMTGFSNGTWMVWNVSGHVRLQVTLASGGTAVISGLFFGSGTVAPPTGTAQFVKADASTQGTWEGVYGGDGYNVIGDTATNPSYVTPAPSGNSLYSWAVGSSSVRAMQEPGSSARIAATWFSTSQFTVDLPFTDSAVHQMEVYCLDWDSLGRAETLQIVDANNNVLDTRSVTGFSGGTWMVWNVSGHVRLQVTLNNGGTAVISGLFFGAWTVAPSTGTAQFVKTDTSTQGSWRGVYGGGGYNVIGDTASNPSYVTPAPSGNSLYTWAVGSSDVRAMQEPGLSTRIAATWFTTSQFTVDLPLTGSATHQMAVYCLDWDNLGRAQTIQILDANNNVLDTRSVSSFSGGTWIVWNISGHVRLQVTLASGGTAVISGIFFGP